MRSFKFDPDLEIEFQTATAPEGEGDFSCGNRSPIPRSSFTRDRHGAKGFSVVPSWVVAEIAHARAHNAALLVCVILKRMRMRTETTVFLTAAIWAEIGAPSERERQTILRHLRLIPRVLKLEPRRKRHTHYQVSLGETWFDQLGTGNK